MFRFSSAVFHTGFTNFIIKHIIFKEYLTAEFLNDFSLLYSESVVAELLTIIILLKLL